MDDIKQTTQDMHDTSVDNTERDFEFGYVLRAEEHGEVMREILTRHGAKILRMEHIRKISLAYPIKKQETGFFGACVASCAPVAIREIEKEAKLDQRILRLLVLAEPITQKLGGEETQAQMHEQKSMERTKRQAGENTGTAKTKERTATNEELEKRLEEILG